MIGTYEQRKVANDTSKSGIAVDTVYSIEEGYETALCDGSGEWIPVERYPDVESAKLGHKKWLEFADTGDGKEVVKLGGLGGLVEDKIVTLSI